MRWVALLMMAVLMVGCKSSDPPAQVSTTVPVPTSTSTSTTIPIELSEDEQAIAAARQAVLDADVMGADFAQNSAATVAHQGDTIEVTLVPADPDVIGATAVIILRKDDLSIVDVKHYR
jgi:hypothetical protein